MEFADREGQAYAMLAIVPEKLMLLRYEPLEPSEFLKLLLAERRQILERQAEAMIEHYRQDSEWKELMAGSNFKFKRYHKDTKYRFVVLNYT